MKFGDIFDFQGGSQPPKDTFIYEPQENYIRLLQIRDFGENEVPTYVSKDSVTKFCTKDDVMIARYGASLGRILMGMEGAYNVALVRMIFDKALIYHRYVYYLLQTPLFQTPIHMISRSAQNGFNKSDVFPIRLPLAPLNEQRRIVDAIETQFTRLDAAVAALKRAQANLKRYRASVLKAACEGRLVPTEAELARIQGRDYEPAPVLLARILAERRRQWEDEAWQKEIEKAQKKAAQAQRKAAGLPARIRDLEPDEWQNLPEEEYASYLPKNDKWKAKYKEPQPPDTSELPDLPEGWCWTKVKDVGNVQLGRQRAPQYHNGPYMRPYLRVANVFEDRIDISDVLEMNFEPTEFEKYRLEYGDILLNEGQSPEFLGRPAMFRNEIQDACFQNTLIRFQAYDCLDRQYALIQFRSYMHTRRFMDESQITTNIAHLSVGRFSEIEFPLPPLAEQIRIVAEVERRLSLIDQLEKTVEADLTRAKRLRQSILKRAFEGQLVPQDPNDEPASVLLERIQAERNGQPVQAELPL